MGKAQETHKSKVIVPLWHDPVTHVTTTLSPQAQIIAEKIAYCLDAMRMLLLLTDLLRDQAAKRMISRFCFVYLDAVVGDPANFAAQLRNLLQVPNTSMVARQISRLRTDYRSYYEPIRDKVAVAHDETDIGVLLEAWNAMDMTALSILVTDAEAIYSELGALEPSLPRVRPAHTLISASVEKRLSRMALYGAPTRPSYGVGSFSAASTTEFVSLPTHPLQAYGMRINAVRDSLVLDERLAAACTSDLPLLRLIKGMWATDIINVLDILYGRHAGATCFQSIMEELENKGPFTYPGIRVLQSYRTSRSIRIVTLEGRVRRVRNTVGAHIEAAQTHPLSALLRDMDALSVDDLKLLTTRTEAAFQNCCKSQTETAWFLLHGQPMGGDVISVIPVAEAQREFNDTGPA